jgi:hypothetical protein
LAEIRVQAFAEIRVQGVGMRLGFRALAEIRDQGVDRD